MKVTRLDIPDVLLIEPRKHGDARGFFSETFRMSALAEVGFTRGFVQDNHVFSSTRGIVRGLHFQLAPHSQDKLLRVTRGAILDVAVDLRPLSPTFGEHVALELSVDNWRQLLVPRGFAHGYQTLTADAEVIYKVTDYYVPEAERGLLWSDPELAIEWPIGPAEASLNERDGRLPTLSELRPTLSQAWD